MSLKLQIETGESEELCYLIGVVIKHHIVFTVFGSIWETHFFYRY